MYLLQLVQVGDVLHADRELHGHGASCEHTAISGISNLHLLYAWETMIEEITCIIASQIIINSWTIFNYKEACGVKNNS